MRPTMSRGAPRTSLLRAGSVGDTTDEWKHRSGERPHPHPADELDFRPVGLRGEHHPPLQEPLEEPPGPRNLATHQPAPVGDHRAHPLVQDLPVNRTRLAEATQPLQFRPERCPPALTAP